MKVWTIAATAVRRFTRERSNIFFVFIFPLLLVLVIGLVFGGGGRPRLGVVADTTDPLAAEIVAALEAEDAVEVVMIDDADQLETAVARQTLTAGIVLPSGYGTRLLSGERVSIDYMAQPGTVGSSVSVAVDAAVAAQAVRLRAAQAIADGEDLAAALEAVDDATVPDIGVTTTAAVGESDFDFSAFGQFGFGAAQNLALFVWLTSLTTSAYLIQNRKLGVTRRMAATPTGARQILFGELLGRYGIAAVQAAIVVGLTALLFGVRWGDPLAVVALVAAYCLVGTGAGMLLGSLLRTEEQSSAIGLGLGLGMAALGGSMVPLEVFSEGMRRLAHLVTPHAWLIDGITELVSDGGGIGSVAPELGVLAGVGMALTGLALVAFRRSLVRPT